MKSFNSTIALWLLLAFVCQLQNCANCHATSIQQEEPASRSQQEPETPKEALPALRQPGDDVTTELKDPVESTDDKKAKSVARYMEGLAEQKKGNLSEAIEAFRKSAEADPSAPEPVRAHAVLLMRLGREPEALKMARKAIALDADDFETRLQMALLVRRRGDLVEAIKLVEAALKSKRLKQASQDAIRVHSIRGGLYREAGVAAKAVESYEVLLNALERPEDFGLDFRQHQALLKDRGTGYEAIGRLMLEVGRNDRAIDAFQALVKSQPNSSGNYLVYLATAQFRKDQLDEAEKNLNRYFEANRRSRQSLELLANIYRASNRSSKVKDRLIELAETSTNPAAVKLYLGEFLIEQGDAESAEEVYLAILSDSGDSDAHLGLVRVDILKRDAQSLLNRISKATRARIQIEELTPLKANIVNEKEFAQHVVAESLRVLDERNDQHPSETFFYSQIAEALKLESDEEKLLLATLEKNPDKRILIRAMSRLGFNQLLQDKYAESALTYRQLLAVSGLPTQERVVGLYRLSQAESFNGNHEDAIKALQAALKLRPQHPELTYQLGWAQLQGEKNEDAARSLRAAIKLAEQDGDLEARSGIMLGALYTRQREWNSAIEAYRAVLEVPELSDELSRRCRIALSNAYVQKGDLPNGERILEEVYESASDDPGVNNDLGYLYADQNKNLEKAEKMIRFALEAEPDNPAYLDSLGWVLYRLNRNEEALDVLQKANSDPDYRDSTIIEHLGDVQKALGRMEAAKKTWQEALEVEKKSSLPNDEVINRLSEKVTTPLPVDANGKKPEESGN